MIRLRESSDWLLKKIARESEDGIGWAGWIPGYRKHKKVLRHLGVRGAMIFRIAGNRQIFEHCGCDTQTMERLLKSYPEFIPGTFTPVNAEGNQLRGEFAAGGLDEQTGHS